MPFETSKRELDVDELADRLEQVHDIDPETARRRAKDAL